MELRQFKSGCHLQKTPADRLVFLSFLQGLPLYYSQCYSFITRRKNILKLCRLFAKMHAVKRSCPHFPGLDTGPASHSMWAGKRNDTGNLPNF